MRIGAFEVIEPIPALNDPYVFAILQPWIDVNNVGTLVLKELEHQYGAEELARLAKPGHFFDFTRYRPTLYLEGGIRRIHSQYDSSLCQKRRRKRPSLSSPSLNPMLCPRFISILS